MSGLKPSYASGFVPLDGPRRRVYSPYVFETISRWISFVPP